MADSVNMTTAEAATEEGKLPLNRLRLLGTVTLPKRSKALLRGPDGRTMTVRAGEKTPYGTIETIGEGFIIVHTGIATRRIKMPS